MSRLTGNSAGLAVICVAQFVVVLDVTIVTTALPAIGTDLDASTARLSWVITAYTVVLAGLLVLGGRIADLAGARRMFRIGLVLFSLASTACALAWSPEALIAARIAQGAGAALLAPAALAALTGMTPPSQRRTALGWWTAAAAGGGAGGWLLGGLITEFAGWRWVFAVNAPIGLVTLLVSFRALSGPGSRLGRGRLDVLGAVTATAGIAAAALGLTWLAERPAHWSGWACAATASVLVMLLVRIERRVEVPLIPGRLLRTPGVVAGNLTAAAVTGSTTPAMFAVALYVQDTLRLSPAKAGLLFPALNVAVIAGSLAGPAGLRRFGVPRVLLGGFGAIVAGVLALTFLPAQGLPVALLVTSLALMGFGLGGASVASTTVGTQYVADADRGIAGGVLNSTAQLGTALGLALASPLIALAPMTGYRLGFVVAALVAVLGLVAVRTVPSPRDDCADGTGPRRTAPQRAGGLG